MKKIFYILLLALLVFNTIGYRYAINYFSKETSVLLNNNIESKNYKTDDLVEIKIPLNNPYISDQEIEDAFGETKVKGKFYQYVKKRIIENTLYLYCLPNEKKDVLVNSENNLASNNTEATSNKKENKQQMPIALKIMQQEFIEVKQIKFHNSFSLQNDAKSYSLFKTKMKAQFIVSKDIQPPNVTA